MDETMQACEIPDDQLTPEQLAERIKWREYHAKEEAYDNSWKKNEANGFNCNFKRRVADEKTDFSNLKIDFLDWDFHLKVGEPWQVIRIDGYPHRYDNCLYCYPLKLGNNPEDFKNGLIPFDTDWNILKWNIEIEEYTSIRYKWDEIRHSHGVVGKLYRNGKIFHTVNCSNETDAFAYLTIAKNKANMHPAAHFASRKWKESIIGHKVWYHGNPCVISGVGDYGTIMFRISPDNPENKIFPPCHWDSDKDGICYKEAWYESNYHEGCNVEWDCDDIKYFRKENK